MSDDEMPKKSHVKTNFQSQSNAILRSPATNDLYIQGYQKEYGKLDAQKHWALDNGQMDIENGTSFSLPRNRIKSKSKNKSKNKTACGYMRSCCFYTTTIFGALIFSFWIGNQYVVDMFIQ